MYPKITQFLADHADIDTVEVVLSDLNGVFRGKWLPRDGMAALLEGRFKMPLSSVAPDIWGRDVPALCEVTGDADGLCTPVDRSIRRLPWLARPTAQLFLQLNGADGAPWGFDPRAVLKSVFERFRERGLTPVCAPELEFSLFAEQRDADGRPQVATTRVNGDTLLGGQLYSTELMREHEDLLHAIRATCGVLDLPLDGLLKELAPGQYEINLHHVDDPLTAADNAQLLKQSIKAEARRHGFIASFMAKPFGDRDGNGFHTHVSLLDAAGRNLFDDGGERGSAALRHAIAGLAEVMPDSMLVFAPHLNSWRRLQRGVHGPLAPTWGYENRYVALRVPNGAPSARRIEHRIAGADANPYLVLAVILAGILHGLDAGREPAPPSSEGPESQQAGLPNTWRAALQAFGNSPFIEEYLGVQLRHALSEVKRVEQDTFAAAVSPLEYDSYLVLA
jgi:glutamine synthetase